jgi:hypothetical protein
MHFDLSQINIYLALWGSIGPLVGIWIGHLLTRSWQRRQWVMDRRHQEFQELVAALDASFLAEATRSDSSMELTPEERRDKARRTSDLFQVVRTRIFVAGDMKKLDLERDWRIAVGLYRKESDGPLFEEAYSELSAKLVELATARGPR